MFLPCVKAVAIAFALSGGTAASLANPSPGRAVPAHEVPVPDTVSPQLQKRMGQPDVKWPAQLPDTNEGWNTFWDPDPKLTGQKIADLLKKFDLMLEEKRYGGVACFEVIPRRIATKNRHRLLVHIHGGGYVLGSGKSGITEAVLVAGKSGIRTISIDYRMPPQFPFPVPMDDTVAAWKAINTTQPRFKIGLFGTSTGGAMVLALVQRAKIEGLPLPKAIVSGTPWSDLSETGDSYFTNKYLDPMPYDGFLRTAAHQYANGLDLRDPRLSPIYADFKDFPPTLLLSGTRDIFLSNTVRVDRKIRDAGGQSELIVYEAQSHGRYLAGLEYPETLTFLDDLSKFWDRWLR